jgi:hypothetical protein
VTDWLAWHRAYEDPESTLSRRLVVVQRILDDAVAALGRERLRVLSLCAGDGRDVLPVLGEWRDRKAISGRLIEAQPELVDRARTFVARERLEAVEVVCGDAARPAIYDGALPADLIVACGIFGNVSDADVHGFVESLPALCAEGANVVWTRHRHEPDLTPSIRGWFAEAGFEERAFDSPGPNDFSVGRHQLVLPPRAIPLRDPLFSFVR